AYRADQDYTVLVFWTDYQGKVLDTAGRPLSSFRADPGAPLPPANSSRPWDFATFRRGPLPHPPFARPAPGSAAPPPHRAARPGHRPLTVNGTHTQGEQYDDTSTITPDPQSLHPVKVYSSDNTTLLGVGKYATAFGSGTASSDQFGTGRDGDLTVPLGQTVLT